MWEALASGLILGLSCGFSPGPLLTLVLTQTLRHGAREGCKVALAPLLTDAPILAVTLWVARGLAGLDGWLALLSFAGGAFVLFLAWENFRPAEAAAVSESAEPRSWRKGALTNLLNPSPWLFWLTVGVTVLTKAGAGGAAGAAAFLAGFYVCLCGSKMLLAWLAGRSRAFLQGRAYRILMQVLGLCLVGFALLMFRDGVRYLR